MNLNQKKFSEYLKPYNQEEEKKSDENQKDGATFITKKKSRGAPKKEKREKSYLEKSKNDNKASIGKSNFNLKI